MHSAEYIARLVKNFDGAGEYDPLVKAAIANVQDQVDHLSADQKDREDLARSYAEMLGVITAGHALEDQQAAGPTKPRAPTSFPLSR